MSPNPRPLSESNAGVRPASKPTNIASAHRDDEISDSFNDEDEVSTKSGKENNAVSTKRTKPWKENDEMSRRRTKSGKETTDPSSEETDQLKTKFIKIANRYFIHERNPSDRHIRHLVKEEFHLDPNIGAGYVIYRSGMRTFNNMWYELYKTTESIADSFILKHTKYVCVAS